MARGCDGICTSEGDEGFLEFLLPEQGFLLPFFGVYYVDTEQGMAQRLDSTAESPLVHALPRHIP